MLTKKQRVLGERQILLRLQSAIRAHDYFNVYQLYRALFSHYMREYRFLDLEDCLYEGTFYMIQHGQHESAADMSILLIIAFRMSRTDPTDIWRYKLCELYTKLDADCDKRDLFLLNLMDWLSGDGLYINAHFHQDLAYMFYLKQDYREARKHFLYAKNGRWFALTLIELHMRSGYPSEVDIFLVQAVLQLLCIGDDNSAIDTLITYVDNHPFLKPFETPFKLPLLNFTWFLLLACRSHDLSLFECLCQKYEKSINRDPGFQEDLDKIAAVYFYNVCGEPVHIGLKDYFISLFDHLDINEDAPTEITVEHVTRGYRDCVY